VRAVLALLYLSFMFLGCKKSEFVNLDITCPISVNKGDDRSVIGSWKLVKSETVFMSKTNEDYSCNDIIYNFKSNGTLNITSDINNYIGDKQGSYKYSFSTSQLYNGGNQPYTLKINQRAVACSISQGVMTLDDSPLDGPIIYLVRL
jgi:hypothetical protein